MRRTLATVLVPAVLATGCTGTTTDDPADHFPATPAVTVLAGRLTAPWGLAFLPDGSALLTERDTRLIKAVGKDGTVRTVQQVTAADSSGEGGLLGITVSPDYARDRLVYAYYTTAEDNRIARFKLGEEPEPIVTGIPVSGIHNGGRIAFGPDGYLYAGTGDASARGRSQDVTSLGGKVLRMTPEGKPAPDNPFPGSLVWSYGHRNVQGLAWDARGRLYASEFGQNRHDEVNLIQPRHNYGWPTVEGVGGGGRFTDPLVTWAPSEASPSGIAILGQAIYVACLRGERLWWMPIHTDGKLGRPQSLLVGQYGRLRHVAVAPDGSLWVLTSNRDGRGDPVAADDRLLRLDPRALSSD
ncbi:MAG: PQQ-dependent sugar dehydrogenase [Actinomycetota bacterium]|nr:PQQ-dependent sugar dehydrogenase [Actinomycetota bacterium]